MAEKIKTGEIVLMPGQRPPERKHAQVSILQRIDDVMSQDLAPLQKQSGEYKLMFNILQQAIVDLFVGSDGDRRSAATWLTNPNNWVLEFFQIDNEYMYDQLKKHLLL